ncbi:MAG: putative ATP-dependent helicase DinG [Syntrophomonadaceae bacterium]|nr:putative ATP-dependent helicase DinG [Bacillota bacterium]
MATLLKRFVEKNGFEDRDGQKKLFALMEEAFKDKNSIAFMEGGTGNGKTLSYLLPSLYKLNELVKKHRPARLVIGTATIALQKQLVQKDIPQVMKFFKKEFGNDWRLGMSDVRLLAGAKNYLCEKKPVFLLSPEELRDDKEANAVYNFVKKRLGADKFRKLQNIARGIQTNRKPVMRRELDVSIGKIPSEVWDSVCCGGSKKSCTGNCSHKMFLEGDNLSKVVVTNHHFLTRNNIALKDDQKVKGGSSFATQQPTNMAVIDEAHSFSSALDTSNISVKIKELALRINEYLSLMSEDEMNKMSSDEYAITIAPIKGVMNALKEVARRVNAEATLNNTSAVKIGADAISEHILSPLFYAFSDDGKTISNTFLASRFKRAMNAFYGAAIQNLQDQSQTKLWQMRENIKENISDLSACLHSLFLVSGWKDKQGNYGISLKSKSRGAEDTMFTWFENDVKDTYLFSTDLDIYRKNNINAERTLHPYDNIAFVSATLADAYTQKGKGAGLFGFFKKELAGLTAYKRDNFECSVPSDFDWKNAAKLYVPIDIQAPQFSEDKSGQGYKGWSKKTSDYYTDVSDSISNCVKLTNGNNLVLCSSMQQVKYFGKRMEELFRNDDSVKIISQDSSLSTERMLHEMRQGKEPIKVLIGIRTFWQGVDLPGEALRGLFIVKIPFPTPNHPLFKARQKYWQDNKKGSFFFDVVVPEAKKLLKQGNGRLLRSSRPDEYGIVVFYDPNFAAYMKDPKANAKPYMSSIRTAFPADIPIEKLPLYQIPADVKKFIEKKREEVALLGSVKSAPSK